MVLWVSNQIKMSDETLIYEPGWGPGQVGPRHKLPNVEDDVMVEVPSKVYKLKPETRKALLELSVKIGTDLHGLVPDECWFLNKESRADRVTSMLVTEAALNRVNSNSSFPKSSRIDQFSGGYTETFENPILTWSIDKVGTTKVISKLLNQDFTVISGMIVICRDSKMPDANYNVARRMFGDEVQKIQTEMGRGDLLAPLLEVGKAKEI